MNAETSVVVSAMVFGLVQIAKWSGIPDRFGPQTVIVLSIASTLLWGYSEDALGRQELFSLTAGAVQIAMGASGIFGFSRATASAVTRATAPPSGAGGEPTVDEQPADNVAVPETKPYSILCENCLRVISETDQEPIQGAVLAGDGWHSTCPDCKTALKRPVAKRTNWISDRAS